MSPTRKTEPEAEDVVDEGPALPEAPGAAVYIRHTDSGAVGVITRRQWDDLYSKKVNRSTGGAWFEVVGLDEYDAQVADHEEQQAAEQGRVIQMLETDPDSFVPVVAEAKQVAAGTRELPPDVDPDAT